MITRSRPDSGFSHAPLVEKPQMTTIGRWKGASHAARSDALRSSPAKLNFGSLPSKVPWPINAIQSALAPSFCSSSSAFFRSASAPSFDSPRPITCCRASPLFAACDHCLAHLAKASPYVSSPGALTAMITNGRSSRASFPIATGAKARIKTSMRASCRGGLWPISRSENRL
jgi:hypothetical protein